MVSETTPLAPDPATALDPVTEPSASFGAWLQHLAGAKKQNIQSEGGDEQSKAGELTLPRAPDADDPVGMAKHVIGAFYTQKATPTLVHFAGTFWHWQVNQYTPLEEGLLRQQVYMYMGKGFALPSENAGSLRAFKPNRRRVDDVIDALKSQTFLPASCPPPAWLCSAVGKPPAENILACKNCLFVLPTQEVLPLTPDLFNTCGLDFDYVPNPPPPTLWLSFLEQLWPGDQASKDLLQTWIGYLLTPSTYLQKMVALIGPRRSGKGTIGRVLRDLLGAKNVTGPTGNSLAGRFGLEPLLDKTLAIVPDARFSSWRDEGLVERLLAITGEDTIAIDRKYKPVITLPKLATRLMFLTNEIPQLNDSSGALAGRFVVLRLTRSFYGQEDTDLAEKLRGELPGILAWAVEGWKKLQQQRRLIQPSSGMDVVEQLEELGSPIGMFLKECCFIGQNQEVHVRALFDAWKAWCELTGNKVGTEQAFGRDLRSVVPGITSYRPNISGVRTRIYRGISLGIVPGPQWSAVPSTQTNMEPSGGSKGLGNGKEGYTGTGTIADRSTGVSENV